jgi:signal transduction histidine kinase
MGVHFNNAIESGQLEHQWNPAGRLSDGILSIDLIVPPTEDTKSIVTKMAGAFNLAYQRFLDLQKAEAQAREAKIEAALERVRSRSMAMHKSEELNEVNKIIIEQIKFLNIQLFAAGIHICRENEPVSEAWMGDPSGGGLFGGDRQVPKVIYEHTHDKLSESMYKGWKERESFLVEKIQGEKLKEHMEFMMTILPDPGKFENVTAPEFLIYHLAYFSQGFFVFVTLNPIPEEHTVLIRFAKVFEQTYTRFLDLQKAEEQARESQIETGLERVRSRTLAMQKSDELAETAAELFKQLISLGIEPNRLYIGIVKDESGNMEMWATDEDGTQVGQKFMFNKNENVSVKKLYDGWAAKEKSVIVDMQGKELEDYFHYLNEVMHIPFKGGLTQKRRVQSVAYFSKGFIGMASPDGQGSDTLQLLERFAAVFNLTFTRFNDLKIAEAHAIQAEEDLIKLQTEKLRAEDALIELRATQKQLIQSEKMASLGELTAGIAHEIQNPLNFVNNFSEVSSELIAEMKDELLKGNYEDVTAIANDVIQNLEKINHHGKRADAIVKGMLQHSRASTDKKEQTDINALADEYLRLSYHGLRAKDKSFNARIKTDFDSSLEKINIIPQDIGRVILNLLANAFYVVDEKKKQQPNGYEPTVSIQTKKINNKVEIKVSDNGNGIPQKVLDKIFQPFFTTKPTGQGTGLGLSLSYDIVKAHGGELKVETNEGKGTELKIILPITNNNI